MNPIQSFLTIYYILNECFDLSSNKDDLGMFLGMISPEIWGDGYPIDKAVFDDWVEFINGETISEENILELCIKFFEQYGKYLDLDFSKTEKVLHDKIDKNIVKESAGKAEKMCNKYHYRW